MKHQERAFDVTEPRFAHYEGIERKDVFVGGKLGTVTAAGVKGCDSLERMKSRRVIEPRQWAAADAWAQDYERAGMSTVVVASYGGSVSVGVEAEPERRRAAKERFRRGHAAMTGRGASIVWGVVIENKELKDWPFPAAYTSERFREALDELADFYGVPR